MRRNGIVERRYDFVVEDYKIFKCRRRYDPIEANATGVRRTGENGAGG